MNKHAIYNIGAHIFRTHVIYTSHTTYIQYTDHYRTQLFARHVSPHPRCRCTWDVNWLIFLEFARVCCLGAIRYISHCTMQLDIGTLGSAIWLWGPLPIEAFLFFLGCAEQLQESRLWLYLLASRRKSLPLRNLFHGSCLI